eukprot:scaffold79682_cov48-Phaeocystis_antarctica.AAC.1
MHIRSGRLPTSVQGFVAQHEGTRDKLAFGSHRKRRSICPAAFPQKRSQLREKGKRVNVG